MCTLDVYITNPQWYDTVYIYRVIFNECEIVDSSESHLNHCLGLEIHLFGKFTSYILVLWYHT